MAKIKNTKENYEANINLLPEKEKRDYILRMVSFIIVLFFIILNFFLIFFPRLTLQNDINNLKRDNYSLNMMYNDLYDEFGQLDVTIMIDNKPVKLFDISKNSDAVKLESGQLNLIPIIDDIKEKQNSIDFSYIEKIKYTSESNSITLNMQFISMRDVNSFEAALLEVPYVWNVDRPVQVETPVNEGTERHVVTFVITFDNDLSPKVGELHD